MQRQIIRQNANAGGLAGCCGCDPQPVVVVAAPDATVTWPTIDKKWVWLGAGILALFFLKR